jgi:hypothetical protein
MSKALLKSTGIVSGMTLISRILGFIRDMIYAQLFGAGAGTDAFFVAFRIPNFMRRLFAEGAFSQAFVPVFSQYRTQRSHEELQELVDQVAGTLGLILFGITAAGVLAAPLLVWLFAPGFTQEPDKYELTVAMLQVTFPYLLFISLTAFAGGVLNSCGKFAIPALTPVLLNICMIIAAVWVAPYFDPPAMALAWGVFAAGVTQLLFQIPYLKQLKLLPRPRWAWRAPGVQQVLKLMLPALFGSSVAQVNLLIDTLLASFLVTGSVSWLYYSDRLVEFPLGPVRSGAGHGDSAQSVAPPRGGFPGTVLANTGLGLALDLADWAASDGGAGDSGRAAAGGIVPVRRIQPRGCADVCPQFDGAFHWPAGVHAGQGAGSWLLRPAGYPYPGALRPDRDGGQYRHDSGFNLAAGSCWIGVVHFAGVLPERGNAIPQSAP